MPQWHLTQLQITATFSSNFAVFHTNFTLKKLAQSSDNPCKNWPIKFLRVQFDESRRKLREIKELSIQEKVLCQKHERRQKRNIY